MGLGRSVEPLASSEQESESTGAMRDQVLAAIAEELAMPVAWLDPNPVHLSAATCSAALAVAGVYTVSGRKRNVAMQRTEQIN
jgi:hypothetical protein